MLAYVVPFFIALIVSYAVTPGVKKLAIKIGAIDKPDERKVHTHVIPRLGGLAIYIGFMAAVLYSMPVFSEFFGFLLGAAAIVLLGIWDDIRGQGEIGWTDHCRRDPRRIRRADRVGNEPVRHYPDYPRMAGRPCYCFLDCRFYEHR